MSDQTPPTIVELAWKEELVFTGTAGGIGIVLDSALKAGISPVQALASGLAGCMAMDVVAIVKKGRHDLRGLNVRLTGHRNPEPPKRLLAVELHFTVTGAVASDAIERAIALSREKYCSVWHSMRQDIQMTVTFEVRS